MSAQTDKANAIRLLLGETRNGMNRAIRYNPLTPRFVISDGADLLAKVAGCYWLLDVLATELEPKLLPAINAGEVSTVLVDMHVEANGSARISATHADDAPPFWSRLIECTDFPPGDWLLFEVGALEWDVQAERAKNVIAILLSEH